MAVITNPGEHLFKHKHNKLKNLTWSTAGHTINTDLNLSTNPVVFSNLGATPDTPASGDLKFYTRDDSGTTKLYVLGGDGVETEIGTGGTGATSLAGLSDVGAVTYTEGLVLRANGTDFDSSQLKHSEISGSGTYDHASIDSHILDVSNPHVVTAAQVGAVDLTTNQNVDGEKTFLDIPIIPATNPTNDNQAVRKAYVDAIAAGLSWKPSVKDKDAVGPPSGIVFEVGDRYIAETPSVSGWIGHDEDICQWTASGWYFYDPSIGWAVLTVDDNKGWTWSGSDWVQFNASETYTAGDGLDLSANQFSIDYKANDGLTVKATELSVDYSNNAIGIVSNKLDVLPTGVTNAMLAGSIVDTKLNTISTTNKVNWAAVNKAGSVLNDIANLNAGSPSDNQALTWDESSGKWIPETITAGGIAYTNYIDVAIVDLAPYTYYSWTNQPAAVTELGSSNRSRVRMDLSTADQYRITNNMYAAGFANASLDLQYSTDNLTFQNAYTHPSGSYCKENIGVNYGSWAPLVAGARTDVFLRVVGVSGNAVADPRFNNLHVQFRIPGGDIQTVVDLANYPSGLPVQDNGAYYSPITKTGNYAAAQTDTAVWTPASGKRIHLLGVVLSTNDANDIEVESSNVDVVPPMYFAAHGGAVISGDGELWHGATDAALTISSTANVDHSIMMWGYEAT